MYAYVCKVLHSSLGGGATNIITSPHIRRAGYVYECTCCVYTGRRKNILDRLVVSVQKICKVVLEPGTVWGNEGTAENGATLQSAGTLSVTSGGQVSRTFWHMMLQTGDVIATKVKKKKEDIDG